MCHPNNQAFSFTVLQTSTIFLWNLIIFTNFEVPLILMQSNIQKITRFLEKTKVLGTWGRQIWGSTSLLKPMFFTGWHSLLYFVPFHFEHLVVLSPFSLFFRVKRVIFPSSAHRPNGTISYSTISHPDAKMSLQWQHEPRKNQTNVTFHDSWLASDEILTMANYKHYRKIE